VRITGGTSCGRKLQGPKSKQKTDITIRPTSDRVREAVCNIIGDRFQSSCVLDLFAGTGSFGLEALSRGANHVVFVDNSYEALELIRFNLEKCFANSSAIILKADLNKNYEAKRLFNKLKKTYEFDIVYLDPPYEKKLAENTMKVLEKSDILTANSLVIIEERWNYSIPVTMGRFQQSVQRKYGETGIWIFETR